MIISHDLQLAIQYLQDGQIIAYPTESVFGLGCDPYNSEAVQRLLDLKSREIGQGFILIASNWEQIKDLIQPLSDEELELLNKTWPGPTTWLFPATNKVPSLVSSTSGLIAIRMTAHPVAKALCDAFQKPIVSTSANPKSFPPAKTEIEVQEYFENNIDFIFEGKVGNLEKPTSIRDFISGKIIRE